MKVEFDYQCCLTATMLKCKVNAELNVFKVESKYYLSLFSAITVAMAGSIFLPQKE